MQEKLDLVRELDSIAERVTDDYPAVAVVLKCFCGALAVGTENDYAKHSLAFAQHMLVVLQADAVREITDRREIPS